MEIHSRSSSIGWLRDDHMGYRHQEKYSQQFSFPIEIGLREYSNKYLITQKFFSELDQFKKNMTNEFLQLKNEIYEKHFFSNALFIDMPITLDSDSDFQIQIKDVLIKYKKGSSTLKIFSVDRWQKRKPVEIAFTERSVHLQILIDTFSVEIIIDQTSAITLPSSSQTEEDLLSIKGNLTIKNLRIDELRSF